jgi:DNA-binding transcriptional MerR regulator
VLRVGDVARQLDVTVRTVHWWSESFPMPISRVGGQRRYTQKAINRLRLVKYMLKTERYTIAGARKHYEKLISCNW